MAGMNDITENWRAVPGYDRYEVSDLGRVRSYATRDGGEATVPHLLAHFIVRRYDAVNLMLDVGPRAQKTMKVHGLVMAAFVGPRPPGMHTNHISGNKRDNSLANLEYVTPQENSLHAVRTGLAPIGDRNGSRLHPERLARGDRHPFRINRDLCARGEETGHAKLTPALVAEIREAFDRGEKRSSIMARFGIAKATLYEIANRTTWSHVP